MSVSVVFSGDIFAQQRRGGVSRYFTELHRQLCQSGVHAQVASNLFRSDHLEHGRGVGGRRLPMAFDGRAANRVLAGLVPGAERRAVRSARRTSSSVILHRTNYTDRPNSTDAPTVTTVYDLVLEKYPEYFIKPHESLRVKRSAIASATRLIAISEYTRGELLEHYSLDPSRVSVVQLGVSVATPRMDDLVRLERGPAFLLYVGTRRGYKNFTALLTAFAACESRQTGLHLVAFGGGPPNEVERRLLSDLNIRDAVSFASGDDESLAAHYSSAVAFVYPSLDEGFGLPPLEAMQLGCPVIAANAGAMPEILGDAAEFVDPRDPLEIATAIDLLVSRDQHRFDLVAKGGARASLYRWVDMAGRTMRVYEDALGA